MPKRSASMARSIDCRRTSAADRVGDCGEGVQWPKERKPIFFIQNQSTAARRTCFLRVSACPREPRLTNVWAFINLNEGVVLRFSVQFARINKRSCVCSLAAPHFRIRPPGSSIIRCFRALAADSVPLCDSTAVTAQRLHERARHANLAHQQYRDRWTRTTVPVHIREESYEA